jgi:hypothetical protein
MTGLRSEAFSGQWPLCDIPDFLIRVSTSARASSIYCIQEEGKTKNWYTGRHVPLWLGNRLSLRRIHGCARASTLGFVASGGTAWLGAGSARRGEWRGSCSSRGWISHRISVHARTLCRSAERAILQNRPVEPICQWTLGFRLVQ